MYAQTFDHTDPEQARKIRASIDLQEVAGAITWPAGVRDSADVEGLNQLRAMSNVHTLAQTTERNPSHGLSRAELERMGQAPTFAAPAWLAELERGELSDSIDDTGAAERARIQQEYDAQLAALHGKDFT